MRLGYSLLLASLASACGAKQQEPIVPDCNGGMQAIATLCSYDTVKQQLVYNGCTSYDLGNDTAQQHAANEWVDCVEAASTCEDAEACPSYMGE